MSVRSLVSEADRLRVIGKLSEQLISHLRDKRIDPRDIDIADRIRLLACESHEFIVMNAENFLRELDADSA